MSMRFRGGQREDRSLEDVACGRALNGMVTDEEGQTHRLGKKQQEERRGG